MPLNFNLVSSWLRERLKRPLPGAAAHDLMRATPIGSVIPKFEHKTPPKPGGVLILLYPKDGRVCFPLTKRPEYLGTHSGQVSFPGGKAEEGENAEETALREAWEEVGVKATDIEIAGRLSDFFVIPSNFIVTPVVAFQNSRPSFTADPVEVVRVIEADLDDVLRDDAIAVKEIMAARTFPLMAPHFLLGDEVVWGATAMMLNELRVILREKVQELTA